MRPTSALQMWLQTLTMMQQTVLLTAIRGPDGIAKTHVAKLINRWLRRCILISAFDGCVLKSPGDPRGGSFTGPSIIMTGSSDGDWETPMHAVCSDYIRATDELPAHYQAHIRNAAQIMGYKHPDRRVQMFWNTFYQRICKDAHMNPETEEQMDYRLGDDRTQWIKSSDESGWGSDDRSELARAAS